MSYPHKPRQNVDNFFNLWINKKVFCCDYFFAVIQSKQVHYICEYSLKISNGELSEWSNVSLSKSDEVQASGGSNPPLSAKRLMEKV